MTRYPRGARRTLSEAEQVELLLGAPPADPPQFASAADRAEALRALHELDAGRGEVGLLIRDGVVIREANRRHRQHPQDWERPDPGYVFDPFACRRCVPTGYVPVASGHAGREAAS